MSEECNTFLSGGVLHYILTCRSGKNGFGLPTLDYYGSKIPCKEHVHKGNAGQRIRELTNPNDDAHTDEYMIQISSASGEAWLIKYADLIENTSSFCYSLHEPNTENPIKRAREFYLPILNRTTEVLANTSFEKYPKTAEAMQMTLEVYTDLLLSRIKLLERKQ